MEKKSKILKQKLPKLTKKQTGFVDDFVATGNGTQAALKNYDIEGENAENVAAVIANENLRKPNVVLAVEIKQETLKSALQKQGVTPEKIAEKINVLLEAKIKKKPDVNAIDKGLKHATAIYGVEDPEDKPKAVTNTYNFIFNPETQAEIKEIEAKIKARLIKPNVQPD